MQGKRNSKLIPSGIWFQWWQPQMYTGPLTDVRVRRALQWAFDRQTGNKVAFGGKGTVTWNPVREDAVLDRQEVAGRRADAVVRSRAGPRAMLAAAGVSNLKLNLMILKENGPWTRESQALQQGFKKAGVDADTPGDPVDPVVRPALHEAEPRGHRSQRGDAAVPVGAGRELHVEGVAAEEPAEVSEAGDPGARGRVQQGVHLRYGGCNTRRR